MPPRELTLTAENFPEAGLDHQILECFARAVGDVQRTTAARVARAQMPKVARAKALLSTVEEQLDRANCLYSLDADGALSKVVRDVSLVEVTLRASVKKKKGRPPLPWHAMLGPLVDQLRQTGENVETAVLILAKRAHSVWALVTWLSYAVPAIDSICYVTGRFAMPLTPAELRTLWGGTIQPMAALPFTPEIVLPSFMFRTPPESHSARRGSVNTAPYSRDPLKTVILDRNDRDEYPDQIETIAERLRRAYWPAGKKTVRNR